VADPEYKGVWRDGDYLITPHRIAQFPPRCIACGNEQNPRLLSCKVRKRPGLLQLLVWFTGVFAPSVTIKPYLCDYHHKKELLSRWKGHILILIALPMIIIPTVMALKGAESPTLFTAIAVGTGLAWVWVYYRIFRRRVIWARQIKKWDAWIPDVDPAVLALIPELPA
jgi:hypothetical protein